MKKMMLLLFIAFSVHNAIAQKHVGIGTSNPLAALHVADSSVLFTGQAILPLNATPPPVSGAGTRMMWYADKAAFRLGYVSGTNWDKDSVGPFSFAAGYNTKASGVLATATGNATTASGSNATAMGNGTIAYGFESVAMGFNTIALGRSSVAMGYGTIASGNFTSAMGTNVSTNGFVGSFIIGDASSGTISNCFRDEEFRARFDGGYALYTNTATTTGVFMLNGANAWSSISDSTKKEKFRQTDGEYVLSSISKMRLGSWNYKFQNAKIFRHYGPMAQEFYKAFGNDGIGKIGCDTLINSADIDGVMMIGIQALEKRSASLATANNNLLQENAALQKKMNDMQDQLTKNNIQLADKLALLEKKLNEVMALNQKDNADKSLVIETKQ